MFERFTERARQVVVKAQEAAREWKSPIIDIQHVALGIFREEEGLGARTLENLGIQEVLITDTLEIGDFDDPSQLPFTDRAKQSMELALREALSLGHNYIGTEHLLLGVLRTDWGQEFFEAEQIRLEVIRMLGGPRRAQPVPPSRSDTPEVLPPYLDPDVLWRIIEGWMDLCRRQNEERHDLKQRVRELEAQLEARA